ncbi:hypothetical protein EB73_29445 [Mycobacterium sp. SWH-M3]|nr:hypothetical protein EB73_29445 [Mycobacterium sp. SWH-M3]
MSEWGALPPDVNSARFWLGEGAGSFFASAAQLEALAAALLGILGGHEGVAAALAGSWAAPTGEIAVEANQPYAAWLATVFGMLQHAAMSIQTAGTAFETNKAATPTPLEVEENQTEHVTLQANNFLGMLTPLIVANRTRYFSDMWVRSAANMYSYAAASAGTVQAIPPLPPPPPTASPMAGDPTAAAALAGKQPMKEALKAADPTEAVSSTVMPMLSQLGQLPSQAGQVLQGPQGALSSLTQGPQQAIQPFMSMFQQFGGGLNGLDAAGLSETAAGSSWLSGFPPAGGPVSASLSGGGGFGGGGSALSGAMSPLRGPVSWSSTVNAASPEASLVSRVTEARAATTVPAASPAMGGSGMMAPMMAGGHQAGSNDDKRSASEQSASTLTAAADLYRAPTSVPIVTGASGSQFSNGEGGR